MSGTRGKEDSSLVNILHEIEANGGLSSGSRYSSLDPGYLSDVRIGVGSQKHTARCKSLDEIENESSTSVDDADGYSFYRSQRDKRDRIAERDNMASQIDDDDYGDYDDDDV